MKIGVIADLHIDLNMKEGKDVVRSLIHYMKTIDGLDVLLIAGDISEDYLLTMNVVERIKAETKVKVYYVPGNHDLWNGKNPELTTHQIIEAYKQDENCLFGRAITLRDDLVLIGHTGWYDYSFGNGERFSDEEFKKGHYKGRTWQDKLKVNFGQCDQEVHDEMLKILEALFEQHQDKQVIFMTHMINHHSFTVPVENRENWEFFNGFLGSEGYETLIKKYKPAYAISGHVHYRKKFKEKGVQYLCPCLGYASQFKMFELSNENVRYNIKQTMEIFEV